MIPQKLKYGDEIRVIAPSRSMAILSEKTINLAKERLEKKDSNILLDTSKKCLCKIKKLI